MVAAEPVRILPPVQVAVPATFSVRTVMSFTPAPLMFSAAATGTTVVPVPVMVPPVQLSVVVAVTVLVPLSVPPEIASVGTLTAEALLKFAVPALSEVDVTL
jgi:hypothetical protein